MLGYYRVENPGVLEAAAGGLARHGRHRRHRPAGFITIKGRAKRFAKVGGEMVSLSAVEAMAAETLAEPAHRGRGAARCAQGRASRDADNERQLQARGNPAASKAKGASELTIPAEIMVVSSIPLLGSGKPDYVAALALAKERAAAQQAPSAAPTVVAIASEAKPRALGVDAAE